VVVAGAIDRQLLPPELIAHAEVDEHLG
jgi:hypothetical protein